MLVLITHALLAGVFDSRPQPERTLLTATSPICTFERRRLASYELGTTSGHGGRSSSLEPMARLAAAPAWKPGADVRRRGCAHLDPPTMRDTWQTDKADRREGAAQLDGACSSTWAAASTVAGAKTCGAG